MKYSFEKINTAQACDALLTGAQRKKQTLERRRRNLGASIKTYRKRMAQLEQESADVQSSLDAYATAYEALSEGRDKAAIKVKIKRLEARQAVLELSTYTYNVAALLVKEIRYNTLDSQVATMEDYIASAEQHRAVLGRTALRVSTVADVWRPATDSAVTIFYKNHDPVRPALPILSPLILNRFESGLRPPLNEKPASAHHLHLYSDSPAADRLYSL